MEDILDNKSRVWIRSIKWIVTPSHHLYSVVDSYILKSLHAHFCLFLRSQLVGF